MTCQINDLQKKIILFAIFIHLIWLGFASYLGLLTKIIEEKGYTNVGPFQFTVMYTVSLFFTIIYPSLPLRIKTQSLLISFFLSIAYFLNWILLHADPGAIYVLSTASGFFSGVSFLLLLLVPSRYLAIICEGQDENTKGSYFALFGAITGSSALISAVASIFTLGFFGSSVFLLALIILGLLATTLGIFLVQDTDDNQQPTECQFSLVWKKLKESLAYYPTLGNIIPVIILQGIALGVISSVMMHFLPKSQSTDSIASISMIFYGVGGWLSSYTCTKITNYFSLNQCGYFVVMLNVIGCISGALTPSIQKLWLSFVAIFFLAAFTFGCDGFISLTLCKAYNKRIEGYVVNMQLRQAFSLVSSFIFTLTNNSLPVSAIMLGIGLLTVPTFYSLSQWKPIMEEQIQEMQDLPSTN